MAENGGVKMRPWVRLTIAIVWAATALVVAILDHTHIPASATVTLDVREVSFKTDSPTMFDAIDQDRFTVSGPADITLSAIPDEHPRTDPNTSIALHVPSTASSCTFYNVRTGPLSLSHQTGIVMLWPKKADPHSYSIRLQGQVAGNVYESGTESAPSSYLCSSVESADTSLLGTLHGHLSSAFATSFETHGDAQLTYRVRSDEIPEENQLRISGLLIVAHVDPTEPGQAKAALLEPATSGMKNEIVFDNVHRTVQLNSNDLVLINPGDDLYIRKFTVDHGIHIEVHGTVRDIRVGAGSQNMKTCMPSIFDTLDNEKRTYGAIPGIVAFVLGLLEAVGLLPRRTK